MKHNITIEYEVEADADVPLDVIVSALVHTPIEMVLTTPDRQERVVTAEPVLGYPQTLQA